MKEFFQKNNKNILDLIQKFESFEEKPSKIIEESEKILQNNIILIEKIDSMERDINA
jgi:5-bromo-4-chloroindolyl phosphate hydrolysis protein